MARQFPLRAGAAVVVLAVLPLAGGCAEPFPTLTYAVRYCYRTMAAVDCHALPLPGEESRRVGFYDRPVAVDVEPWPQRLF